MWPVKFYLQVPVKHTCLIIKVTYHWYKLQNSSDKDYPSELNGEQTQSEQKADVLNLDITLQVA